MDHTPQYSSILEYWHFYFKHIQNLVDFGVVWLGAAETPVELGPVFHVPPSHPPALAPAPACVWTLCWPVSWFPLQPDRAGSVVVPVPTSQSAEGRRGVTTSRDNNNNNIVVTGPSWHSSYLKQDSDKVLQRGSIRQSGWCVSCSCDQRSSRETVNKEINTNHF